MRLKELTNFMIMNKTQKMIIALIAGFLAVIIPYYLFFN